MNWEWIVPIVDKIGLVAAVVFATYLFLKFGLGWLVDQVFGSSSDDEDLDSETIGAGESGSDPMEDIPGLHVYSLYTSEHTLIDKHPTESIIRQAIRSLDWVDGFYVVTLVTSPGVALTVSGSLNPEDGLSSDYRDSGNNVHRITREPPTTVRNMEDLLVSFHRGDGRWEQMYDYD